MNNSLFDRVVELCKEKGISQRKLQEDIGMSTGALSKWKTSTPNATLLQKVADYFGVTVDYLTGKSPYRNQDHMLQCWQEEHQITPDMVLPDGSIVEFTADDAMTIHSTGGVVNYVYIDPETRQIAEKIKDNDQLKRMMKYLEHMSKTKIDAIYNMVKAMDEE